jgi:hypothetical protein
VEFAIKKEERVSGDKVDLTRAQIGPSEADIEVDV